MYQIGDINCLSKDDPVFDDYDKAIAAAVEMSYNDGFIGVWTSQDDGSETLAIVYQQEVFEKS